MKSTKKKKEKSEAHKLYEIMLRDGYFLSELEYYVFVKVMILVYYNQHFSNFKLKSNLLNFCVLCKCKNEHFTIIIRKISHCLIQNLLL